MAEHTTLLYEVDDAVATVTLNRPERLNTIVPPMPEEFEACIHQAAADDAVKVVIVRGAGRSFCAGYDFADGFHHWDDKLTTDGRWDPGKDFIGNGSFGPTQRFMSMWRIPKPVIAQVHGWCVGGGSDMALCADLVIASEDAQIGTPYSRIWGCYLSGMWIYRLGLAKAKEHALTGRPLSGRQAAEVELINAAVPFDELEAEVARRARGARADPRVAARGDEGDRQPGLREHGAGQHADPGPDPGRADAQHPGRPPLHRPRRERRRRGRHRRARPTLRRLQPGPSESRPDPRNVIRPGPPTA